MAEQKNMLKAFLEELTRKYQQTLSRKKAIEEQNAKLEEEIKNLSSMDLNFGGRRSSVIYSERKIDSSASEIEVNFNELLDEDCEPAPADFCDSCLKTFNLNLHYNNAQLDALLHSEILEFEEQVALANERKKPALCLLFEKLRTIIAETFKTPFELSTYGSLATGLNLPWSDIDLLLGFSDEANPKALEMLEEAFSRSPDFLEVRYIRGATIPVLKLIASSEYEDFKIDITLREARHSGMNCVALIQQYMACYPALKPLVILLKQLMGLCKVNDPYQHGLSSYGLVLMVVAFFQWLCLNGLYEAISDKYGRLLIELLKHYGSFFDYVNWKIMPSLPQDALTNPYQQVI